MNWTCEHDKEAVIIQDYRGVGRQKRQVAPSIILHFSKTLSSFQHSFSFKQARTESFQQDGAPPHWKLSEQAYLNENLPERWIGRAGNGDRVLLKWPPRSPDLTPCDFFLLGYEKGLVYVSSLLTNVVKLKQRISSALETVTEQKTCCSVFEMNSVIA